MENAESTVELRPMGIGDILDATFRLYKSRFVAFVLIALVAYVPFSLVAALFTAKMAEIEAAQTAPNPGDMLLGIIPFILMAIIVMPLCQGAMIHNISESYLGRSLSVGESYKRALPKLLRLLGASLVSGFIVGIGFLLLIVPGVIFSLWFMLVTSVVMLESGSAMKSMRRSKLLMAGNLGKGFLIVLVIGIIGFAYGLATGGITEAFLGESPFIQGFVSTLLSVLIVPIQTAPIILFYYDLRIRKEGFDLEQLAASLASSDDDDPFPDVATVE